MWNTINIFLKAVDDFVWGVPLMVLIMAGGIMLTVRLGLLQMVRLCKDNIEVLKDSSR